MLMRKTHTQNAKPTSFFLCSSCEKDESPCVQLCTLRKWWTSLHLYILLLLSLQFVLFSNLHTLFWFSPWRVSIITAIVSERFGLTNIISVESSASLFFFLVCVCVTCKNQQRKKHQNNNDNNITKF